MNKTQAKELIVSQFNVESADLFFVNDMLLSSNNYQGFGKYDGVKPIVYASRQGLIYIVKKQGDKYVATETKGRAKTDNHYYINILGADGTVKNYSVSRMVWQAMTGLKMKKGMVIHHINGDTSDNSEDNLMLLGAKQNNRLYINNATNENVNCINAMRPKPSINGNEWVVAGDLMVHPDGRVKNIATGRVLTPQLKDGRCSIYYRANGKSHNVSLGKLYVQAFYYNEIGTNVTLMKKPDDHFNPRNYYLVDRNLK